MFTFEFLKVGHFVLRSAKHGAFEILEIVAPGASALRARAIARIEIERDDAPSLRVTRVPPDERIIPGRSCAHVDSITLTSWRDELPTDFELNASGTEDGLDLVLSGHRHYHLFWWRVQFEVVVDDVIIHGPFLADNPSS